MKKDKIFFALSILLALLVAAVSLTGIFTENFYVKETPNWQAQSLGQDIIDLVLLVPCLIVTSFFAFRGNISGKLLQGGVLLYLIYTFTIYSFDVHFNKLFIFYCIILGLSFYLFIYFLYKQSYSGSFEKSRIVKITAIYFISVAVIFYALWLSEIIPSIITGTVPQSTVEAGLPTNAVHVIDLSVILPGIFITGVFLLKGKGQGFILAPVILTFFILMNITIGTLIFIMNSRGITADISLSYVFSVLTIISVIFLALFLKKLPKES